MVVIKEVQKRATRMLTSVEMFTGKLVFMVGEHVALHAPSVYI